MRTKYDNVFVNPDFNDIGCEDWTSIAFDLDSVLNEGDYLRDYVASAFGTTMEKVKGFEDGHEVFHFEIPGVGYDAMGRVINRAILEESPSALHTPFMPDVMRWVFTQTDSPIAVVTARHPSTVGVTHDWLVEHLDGVPFNAYIIDGESKSTVLNYLGADIFIDDRWKTVNGLINKIPYPVLYNRPWNMGRAEDLPVIRVRDLRDVIPLLNIIRGDIPMSWPWYIPYPEPRGDRIYDSGF